MFSISVAHIAFDYSPVMLLHQAALVVAFHSHGVHFALRHAALASIVAVAIMLMNENCASLSITSATMFLFGHPLAIIVIAQARSRRRFSMGVLSNSPLTFYVVHLLLLALVNVMLGFN